MSDQNATPLSPDVYVYSDEDEDALPMKSGTSASATRGEEKSQLLKPQRLPPIQSHRHRRIGSDPAGIRMGSSQLPTGRQTGRGLYLPNSAARPGSYGSFDIGLNIEQSQPTHPTLPSRRKPSRSPNARIRLERSASGKRLVERTLSGQRIPSNRSLNSNSSPSPSLRSPHSPSLRSSNSKIIQPRPSLSIPNLKDVNDVRPKRRESMRKMQIRLKEVDYKIEMADIKGKQQSKTCRDLLFAFLFYAQLAMMIYLGVCYGPKAVGVVNTTSAGTPASGDIVFKYRNVMLLAIIGGILSIVISMLALVLMTVFAKKVIQMALYVAITFSLLWSLLGLVLSPKNFVPISGMVALGLSMAYMFVVWDRIPFESVNLSTALTGIRSRTGVLMIAFGGQVMALIWIIFFTFTCIGIYDAILDDNVVIEKKWKMLAFCGLGFSYYWSHQVIMNVVHVSVAGVMSDWLNTPQSIAVNELRCVGKAFLRASLFSFGSICMGSLLSGLMQILRQVSEYLRPKRQESDPKQHILVFLQGSLLLFQECVVACIDFVGDKFNLYVFVYIGMYGYSFLEAGDHISKLFRRRGWIKFLSDDLVSNLLLMVNLVIGGLVGCLSVLIESSERLQLTSVHRSILTSFLMGFCIGVVISSILLGVISSSVNSVVVFFAESPKLLEDNHPNLSHEMRGAWKSCYPDLVDYVDTEQYDSLQSSQKSEKCMNMLL